jgi:hypothetical protein
VALSDSDIEGFVDVLFNHEIHETHENDN